jgi:hypothetical protein
MPFPLSPMLLLCVILQLLLGQDGADMASEVLPAQLLRRIEAAWTTQQQQATQQQATLAGT